MSIAFLILGPPTPPAFDPDVARWQTVPIPSKADRAERAVWEYAANGSKLEWRVLSRNGRVYARLGGDVPTAPLNFPGSWLKRGWSAALPVPNGWLVGENHGEWGGCLGWTSADGKQKTKISDDQIVAFFELPTGRYAVEGLAHLGISRGSVLRLERSARAPGWKATKVVDLPAAPYAVAIGGEGAALVTLSTGVVAFTPDRPLRTILKDAPWRGLYPNSAVLSSDERKLYVGMRQYVGELDLRTNVLRLLVPSRTLLNRLSRDDERSVRAQAGS